MITRTEIVRRGNKYYTITRDANSETRKVISIRPATYDEIEEYKKRFKK